MSPPSAYVWAMHAPTPNVSRNAQWVLDFCVLGFYSSCAAFLWLSRNRPTEPAPENGHVVELNNKGHAFYVTQAESLVQPASFLFVATGLATMFALMRLDGTNTPTGAPSPMHARISRLLTTGGLIALVIYMSWPV